MKSASVDAASASAVGYSFSTDNSGELASGANIDGVFAPAGSDLSTEIDEWSVQALFDIPVYRPFAERPWCGTTRAPTRPTDRIGST